MSTAYVQNRPTVFLYLLSGFKKGNIPASTLALASVPLRHTLCNFHIPQQVTFFLIGIYFFQEHLLLLLCLKMGPGLIIY